MLPLLISGILITISSSYFMDLYKYMKTIKKTISIREILKNCENDTERGHFQEGIAKLFAFHGCIAKLKDFSPSISNINNNELIKKCELRDLYYDNKNNKRSFKGNKGTASDITMISNKDDKTLLVISSKLNCDSIGKLDISDMFMYVNDYEKNGYKIIYGFVVDNREKLLKKAKKADNTSKKLKDIIEADDTIIIDWNDLDKAYNVFLTNYKDKSVEDAIKESIDSYDIFLRPHQSLTINNTFKLFEKEDSVIWGHVPRSGKSYIMAGAIKQHIGNNYLIITMAKNETCPQYLEIFRNNNFTNYYNVRLLELDNMKDVEDSIKNSENNIIICSDKFLKMNKKEDIKNIPFLKNFDIIFFDEAHYGGSNGLTKKIINYYGKKSKKIYITATYNKPQFYYSIKKECCLIWDAEDIELL